MRRGSLRLSETTSKKRANGGRHGFPPFLVGIYIQASGLAAAKYPYGSRNNIYANGGGSPAAKQLVTTQRRWDVDWSGNYWGSDVYFWKAAGICLGVTDESFGHLSYRWSNPPPGGGGVPTPPSGPIYHGNYVAIQGQEVANCPRDEYRIWAMECSRPSTSVEPSRRYRTARRSPAAATPTTAKTSACACRTRSTRQRATSPMR